MRTPVRGWRYFLCEFCKCHWRETCRDHGTPSISDCPHQCEGSVFGGETPYKSEPDFSLEVDGFGNLANPQTYEFLDPITKETT